MNIIENKTFDAERALYGRCDLIAKNCAFDGPADGESAFKECANIAAEKCFFNLRYPFWHDHGLTIRDSEMTELCRAALWYSDHIEITDSKLHGIKALRECSDAVLRGCDIVSPEFGWSARRVRMEDCDVQSEYFMMRSTDLRFASIPSSTSKIPPSKTAASTPRTPSGTPKTSSCAIACSRANTSPGTARTSPLKTAPSSARSRCATARA